MLHLIIKVSFEHRKDLRQHTQLFTMPTTEMCSTKDFRVHITMVLSYFASLKSSWNIVSQSKGFVLRDSLSLPLSLFNHTSGTAQAASDKLDFTFYKEAWKSTTPLMEFYYNTDTIFSPSVVENWLTPSSFPGGVPEIEFRFNLAEWKISRIS